MYTPARFADKASALDTINQWVKEATGGHIPAALNDIAEDAQLYLGRKIIQPNKEKRKNGQGE